MRKLFLILSVFVFSVGSYAQITRVIPATIGDNTSAVTTSATYGDLFWVFGDSFAAGSNNTTGAGPDASPNTYFRTSDNTFQTLSTDLPGATDGSPWPQFCNDYYAATGIKVAIIPNGIGGTKFVDTWNGTSATYLSAKQDAIDAMSAAGVTRLKGIIIICGVNDARGGDPIASIGAAVGNLFYQLDIDFPNTQIYVVMLGHSATNSQRLSPVRGYVRDQIRAYTNAQIVCQLQAVHEWTPPAGSPGGYYGADNLHLNQTGNNLLGTIINRYMQLPTTYSKYARAIVNSYYSNMSSKLAAVDHWVTTMGENYHRGIVSYFKMKVPDENDLYNDWGLMSTLVDNGFVFSANQFITTNTAQTIRMNISSNNNTYHWTSTDFGIFCKTYDRKGSFGGTTKYLFGTSSGSNVQGVDETSTGGIQYFAYDLGVASLGSGGIADNKHYGVTREGTLKKLWQDGVSTNNETISANSPLTSAPEIGGRNTSGVTLELNTEISHFCWTQSSTCDPAVLYSADNTLESEW